MFYWQVVFLAIVQGLTEFLPVSSSGHLVILQKMFGLQPPIIFDILVHVGTLGAVIFYFRHTLVQIGRSLLKKEKKASWVFWLVVIGTVPAVVTGFFLQNYLVRIFDSVKLVGLALLFTSAFLFSTRFIKKNVKDLNQLKKQDAFIIGCFQALAILPGVSRSGLTIVAGLWQKANRRTAFQFSFLLAVPAIVGALVLQIPQLFKTEFVFLKPALLGMVIAGLTGYFALKFLASILAGNKLWLFGFYCLFVGIIVWLI